MREKLHRGAGWTRERIGVFLGLVVGLSALWLGLAWMRGIDLPPGGDLLRYAATGASLAIIAMLLLALIEAATETRGRHGG